MLTKKLLILPFLILSTVTFILLFGSFGNANAYTNSRPNKDKTFPQLDMDDYGWMINTNLNYHFLIDVSTDVDLMFMTIEELDRYFKLKLRGFIKDFKFIEKEAPNGKTNFVELILDLNKYNDKSTIHYGLLELSVIRCFDCVRGTNYRITYPIAGSETQIKNQVKQIIDDIVEKFAEDYYYMQDLP